VTRPAYVADEPREWRPGDALWADPAHVRYYPMRVLCGSCGGVGCAHCAKPAEPERGRWQRLLGHLTRKDSCAPD
jgi:hypothetical protein